MPIHPKVVELYEKKGYNFDQLCFAEGVLDRQNHRSWHQNLKLMKESDFGIKEKLNIAVRVLHDGKEYFVGTYVISGKSFSGKDVSEQWRRKGMYGMPKFAKTFDGRLNRWVETDQVEEWEYHFEYPFVGEKTTLENYEGKMVPITKLLTDDTTYVITDKKALLSGGSKHYSNRETWLTADRETAIDWCIAERTKKEESMRKDALRERGFA
jgi:hypothetical protein